MAISTHPGALEMEKAVGFGKVCGDGASREVEILKMDVLDQGIKASKIQNQGCPSSIFKKSNRLVPKLPLDTPLKSSLKCILHWNFSILPKWINCSLKPQPQI